MSRVPEGSRYYFEGSAINHLRQVLHIHDPEDPILDTSFRNLDAPLEIFHPLRQKRKVREFFLHGESSFEVLQVEPYHPSGHKTSRYYPLSDQDCGLVVGLLNSTFSQMKEGRWF